MDGFHIWILERLYASLELLVATVLLRFAAMVSLINFLVLAFGFCKLGEDSKWSTKMLYFSFLSVAHGILLVLMVYSPLHVIVLGVAIIAKCIIMCTFSADRDVQLHSVCPNSSPRLDERSSTLRSGRERNNERNERNRNSSVNQRSTQVVHARPAHEETRLLEMKFIPSSNVTVVFAIDEYVGMDVESVAGVFGVSFSFDDKPLEVTIVDIRSDGLVQEQYPGLKLRDKLHAINGNFVSRVSKNIFLRTFKNVRPLVLSFVHADGAGVTTPLHKAVKLGDCTYAEYLLSRDVNLGRINCEDETGRTALDYAIELNDEKIVELLKARGAKEANKTATLKGLGKIKSKKIVEERKFNLDAYIGDKDIRDDFLCPITHDVMQDPVVAQDGFTYERKDIVRWLKTSSKSPMTKEDISSSGLIPNRTLKSAIESWKDEKKLEWEEKEKQRKDMNNPEEEIDEEQVMV